MKRAVSKDKERAGTILRLIGLYGRRCWYCGREIDWQGADMSIPGKKYGETRSEYDSTRIELDHIIPRSKEGDESLDNLALTCSTCNKAKWNQDIFRFLKWLAHIRSGRFNCYVLSRLPKEIVDKLDGSEWDALRKDFFK